jgi:hypothetical protein
MMKIRGWGDEGIISIFRRKMTIKGCWCTRQFSFTGRQTGQLKSRVFFSY